MKPGDRLPILDRIDRRLQVLAASLYRGEPVASARQDAWLRRFYGGCVLLALAALAFLFLNEWLFWRNALPVFPLERSEWRVKVLSEPLGCGAGCPVAAESFFWADSVALNDPTARENLREGRASEVWLGLRLPPERAGELARAGASYLILGWLKGSYSIWVNGSLLQELTEDSPIPQVVSVPAAELARGEELALLIRLLPRPGAKNLVPLAVGMREGFGTHRTAAAFQSFQAFSGAAKPFAVFLVFLVFSAIFFFLWAASPRNREYLQLAIFALVGALPSLLYSNAFSYRLPSGLGMQLYLALVVAKGAAGLSLGLSFSRARPRFLASAGVAGLVLTGLLLSLLSEAELSALRKPLNQYLITFAYLLGAFACGLQAWALWTRERSGFTARLRRRKLLAFGSVLLALAAIQFVQYGAAPGSYLTSVFWDVPELVLVLFLGVVALADYRTQYEMMERTPVSPYHKRTSLPESLAGVVMMLDLKNSETMFRSSLNGSDQFLVPNIIAAIWAAIAERNGTVIKAEGDEVMAFFDSASHPNPFESALRAADLCEERLGRIFARESGEGLGFRAALVYGTIRPIWMEEGKERLPGWAQVGGSMVFVECARLMEIEKAVSGQRGLEGSLLLLSHELLQRYPWEGIRVEGELVFSAERVRGKHDRIYSVSGYRPARRTVGLSRAA